MILWYGPNDDGLGWLYKKLLQTGISISRVEQVDPQRLYETASNDVQRIVLACNCRVQFPEKELAWLRTQFGHLPRAVATDQWFDGAGRSGLPFGPDLRLPWYRWWDGWRDWLEGNPDLLGPFPDLAVGLSRRHQGSLANDTSSAAAPDSSKRFARPDAQGGLLCGRELAEGYRRAIASNHAGTKLQLLSHSPDQTMDLKQRLTENLAWILIDDSWFDLLPATSPEAPWLIWLPKLRSLFPTALIIVSTGFPRWEQWRDWQLAGADELLVKPSYGLGLSRILKSLFTSLSFV